MYPNDTRLRSVPQEPTKNLFQNHSNNQHNLQYQVIAHSRPYDYWHDQYQAYYQKGLQDYLTAIRGCFMIHHMTRFPFLLAHMNRLRHSYKLGKIYSIIPILPQLLDCFAHAFEDTLRSPSGAYHSLVGQYLLEIGHVTKIKYCIDASDSGNVASEELLHWSDIYFKTNYWPSKQYSSKVLSLVNGNPLVLGKLEKLKQLRRENKRYDLCFIVRVWGGHDEVTGIEHILSLLEAVQRVDCRKYLMAYFVSGDIDKYTERMDRHRIPWTTHPIPLSDIWRIASQSHVNIIRLGMHYCIPWRMVDLLALGACIVLDRTPLSNWPIPLQVNKHFLDLGVETSPDLPVAPDWQYRQVDEKLRLLLSNRTLINEISCHTAEYFDSHASPSTVAKSILEKCFESAVKSGAFDLKQFDQTRFI